METKLTCQQLIAECTRLGVKPPSGLKKQDLLDFHNNLLYSLENKLSMEVSSDIKLPMSEFKKRLIPKYCQVEDWFGHLLDYGWATVPIPDFDSEESKNSFYSTLEQCRYKQTGDRTEFRRDDPQTWSHLPPNLHGIFKNNFGHFDWEWKIRQQVKPIFEQICRDSDLVVSFDGACFIPPGKGMAGSWFHCDQGRFSYEGCCVQGVVAISPTGPDDGGLCLIEESHHIFQSYMDSHPLFGFSWGRVDVTDPLVAPLTMVKVCAPAGHIMLFDSRVFHCNLPPEKTSTYPRMVTYVSMLPKKGATEEELKKRQEIFQHRRMTGHWTYGPWMATTAENPRSWGKDYLVPPDEDLDLNEIQMGMIG